MISFDEAVEHLRQAARPLGTEVIPLSKAARRVLASPVKAKIAAPRSNVSAMDGYAVRDADLTAFPTSLRIVAESFAGAGWKGEIASGECVRIFTGAPVPAGADRVVIQENVRREGEIAAIDAHPGGARHIRRRGSDFASGDQLIPPGRLLDPRAMLAAAAADVALLEVYRRPTVQVLGTGDELAEPGTAAGIDDTIPESVSFGVAALAQDWGAVVLDRTRIGDHLRTLEAAAASAVSGADVVVVTGGASVGEKDFAKTMFEPLGLRLHFSKVSIKPGKPVWLGQVGRTLIMGLPGNPTSALVTARLLLAPLLCGVGGRRIDEAMHWRRIPLASPLNECGPRETFHRAYWDGERVALLSNQDSGAQKVLAEANVLIRQRPQAPAQQPGEIVDVLEF